MRWKWILGICVAMVVAVIVTVCVILLSYDFNDLKPVIAQKVRDATGRELGSTIVESYPDVGISLPKSALLWAKL